MAEKRKPRTKPADGGTETRKGLLIDEALKGYTGPLYEVTRAFKYKGVWMRPGKPWIPMGEKFDPQLIATGKYVRILEPRVHTLKDARRERKQERLREERKHARKTNETGRPDPGRIPSPEPGQ